VVAQLGPRTLVEQPARVVVGQLELRTLERLARAAVGQLGPRTLVEQPELAVVARQATPTPEPQARTAVELQAVMPARATRTPRPAAELQAARLPGAMSL
jgi:hypothetical protein